jgi:hypothetical protein
MQSLIVLQLYHCPINQSRKSRHRQQHEDLALSLAATSANPVASSWHLPPLGFQAFFKTKNTTLITVTTQRNQPILL